MPEVADVGEHHGYAVLVGGVDALLVANSLWGKTYQPASAALNCRAMNQAIASRAR